ncbi:MAG: 8-amino-7-oxononanoate synthase [Halieaceae bacterium]|nr:8-amino-7-oxononanoate synthase [Halieaceae bacterium]
MEHWGLEAGLQARREQDLYRQRLTVQGPQGPELRVDGETLLAFCSNDYLGLAADPRVIEAFADGARRFGAGAGASHLVSGHQSPHEALEQALADFTGRDRALLFSSGFMANLGVIDALTGAGDRVLQDRLNHASLLDGARLSGARFRRYAHNDSAALARLLEKPAAGRSLVVTDGVFSMDGDIAHVPELAATCREHNAVLMVDDAHGLGVLGNTGAGSLEHYGMSQTDVPILMGTLGKALGVMGAFVAGPAALIDTLIQSARSYIYTTALPPAAACALQCALGLVREDAALRDALGRNIQQFREGALALGLPLLDSATAIQPIVLGDAATALSWSGNLRAQGLLVPAIRPPTVPNGSARLRVALSAAHSSEQVARLLEALKHARDQHARHR